MNICPNCRYRGVETQCPHDSFPMVDETYEKADRGADLVGRVFDNKYEVEGLLGRGGMGSVWRARHRVMQHHLALKVIRHDASGGLTPIQRFYNEARASSQLQHPNTIRVMDFGATEDGFLYMAMELLRGRDLAAEIRSSGALSPLRAVRIGAQIAQSLDEAHVLGIIHRDLKPSNVFLAEVHLKTDFVKVIDFGISKVAGPVGGENLTGTGLVVGTPRYLSPEAVRGRPVDGRADLYALGIVLFEMLTGTLPFEATTTSALLVAHATEPPRDLPARIGDVLLPTSLRGLVAELLEKDPARRPPRAAVVAERLLRIAAELGGAFEEGDGLGAGRTSPTPGGGEAPDEDANSATAVVARVGTPGGGTATATASLVSPPVVGPNAPPPHSTRADTGALTALAGADVVPPPGLPRRRGALYAGMAIALAVALLVGWAATRGTGRGGGSDTPGKTHAVSVVPTAGSVAGPDVSGAVQAAVIPPSPRDAGSSSDQPAFDAGTPGVDGAAPQSRDDAEAAPVDTAAAPDGMAPPLEVRAAGSPEVPAAAVPSGTEKKTGRTERRPPRTRPKPRPAPEKQEPPPRGDPWAY